MSRIFIGVAWPYSNGPFHIGHLAGAYLPGDIFARYHRLRGDEVLLVSGSDMHGTPTLVRAEQEGTTPEKIARRFDEIHRSTFDRLGFSFDVYTSTHTINHERTVHELFLTLLEHGFVGRRTEENPYCPKHARFLPDRYLLGTCPHCGFESARGDECDRCGRPLEARTLASPRCSLCGTPAEFRPSEHFYLELDRLEARLTEYVAKQSHWRAGTRRVAENFLSGGLHPTPITRDLDWGIPLPLDGYPGKRFYVWFEAVIGYLSASREWAIRAGRPDAWKRYWEEREPVRQYYFIGKDNRFHHTIVWPAILLGVGGLCLPYDVPANEWLLVHGEKLSKSRGGDAEVFVPSLLEHFAPDVIRFYAAFHAPQNHDTEYDEEEFRRISEEILSNQYGNLVQRTLVLARDRHDGRIPAPAEGWAPSLPQGVGQRLRTAHGRIGEEYEAVRLKEGLDVALEEVRAANRAFHEAKPWALPAGERATILYETIWRLQALAIWLAPVLPFSSAEVFDMLGYTEPPGPGDWDRALAPPPPGQALGGVHPIFPRAEPVRAAPHPLGPAAPRSGAAPPPPLAIRAGRILSALAHPEADRLYVLQVDLGEAKPRTIVAGLRSSYAVEELAGRRVAVLANLEPRTIRKMTSQGMVLAAEAGDKAVLLVPPESVATGTLIRGTPPEAHTISIQEFQQAPLAVARIDRAREGERSMASLGERQVEVPGLWPEGRLVVLRLAGPEGGPTEVVSFGPGLALEPSAAVPPGAVVR